MKKILICLIIVLIFVAYSVEAQTDILGLSWGMELSKAKETIERNGMTMIAAGSNNNDSESLRRYGMRSYFMVMGKFGRDDATYNLEFHSSRFAAYNVNIYYTDAQTTKLNFIELKNKLTSKYGNSIRETDSFADWEKNNLFISLFPLYLFTTNTGYIMLTCQNENYFNKEILERYKTIEDMWSASLYPKEIRLIFSNGKITSQTYERDKLIGTEGPDPYIISGNKITILGKYGDTVEMQYILDRNTLKIIIDGDEMEFFRVP
jgi:hypothetical protein